MNLESKLEGDDNNSLDNSLNEFINTLNETKPEELLLESDRCTQFLNFIHEKSLSKLLKVDPSSFSQEHVAQAVSSIKALKTLVIYKPSPFLELDGDHYMYEKIVPTILLLSKFDSFEISTHVGFFLKSTFSSITKDSVLYASNARLCIYLLDICSSFLQSLNQENLPLTNSISKAFISISQSQYHSLNICFIIIQSLLTSVISVPGFFLILKQNFFPKIYKTVSEILSQLKKTTRSFDLDYLQIDNLHLKFSNILSLSLESFSRNAGWCNLSIDWLLLIQTLASFRELDTQLDVAAAALALDLISIIFDGQAGGIAKVEHVTTTPGDSQASKTIDLVIEALSSIVDPAEFSMLFDLIEYTDPFLILKANSLKESLNKNHFTLSCSFPKYQQNTLQFSKLFEELDFLSMPIFSADDLKFFIEKKFDLLSLGEKISLVNMVGLSACYTVGTLDMGSFKCKTCDFGVFMPSDSKIQSPVYTQIFMLILGSDRFTDYKDLRLATLKALRRALNGIDIITIGSDLDEWVIKSLQSTNRDIRIAASMIPPLYSDREYIIKAILRLDLINKDYLVETTILAWAQMAKFSEGQDLNILLRELVKIFSYSNDFYVSQSMYHLRSIASHKGVNLWNLFAPFWSTISIYIVKNKNTNPNILTRFCELVAVSKEIFYARTYEYTVPYIILGGDKPLLEEIANALEWTVEKLILNTISKTFAIFLCKKPNQISTVFQKLVKILPNFAQVEISQIINPSRIEIAYEILKMHDPNDLEKSDRISRVFANLYELLRKKSKKRKKSAIDGEDSGKELSPSMESIELFFEDNILGIISYFSKSIRDSTGKVAHLEKLQGLRGLIKLIECAGSAFSKALPQISVILQSALEDQVLQLEALKVWAHMLKFMSTEELETVTDLTFSVIIQNWDFFTSEAQTEGHKLLRYLIFEKREELQNIIKKRSIPYTYGMLPDLGDIYAEILTMIPPQPEEISPLLPLLVRSSNENVYVVRQTILEINNFLINNQGCIKSAMDNSIQRAHYIEPLYKMLLQTSYQFHNSNTDIPYICAQCLGLLGAADPTKVRIANEISDIVVVHNFYDAKESIYFVSQFMEHFLVKAFVSSTDPNCQAYLAYGIQEYLKFCGLYLGGPTTRSRQESIWDCFSLSSQVIMQPMRNSRYTLTIPEGDEKVHYPLFNPNMDHFQWLTRFVLDLLSHTDDESNPNATRVFKICRKIIINQDASLYNFILPYVALTIVLGNNENYRENIVNEMLIILNTDLEDSDNTQDNLKRCYSSVFSIIDYFNKWMRKRQNYFAELNKAKSRTKTVVPSSAKRDPKNDRPIAIVQEIIGRISADLMAKRSYQCKSYPRAIMYWEQHLKKPLEQKEREGIYSKFMEIYSNINDPDSIDGVARSFQHISIPRKIIQLESTGRWDDALECYESLVHSSNNDWQWDSEYGYNMLQCMKNGGNYEGLLTLLDSMEHSGKEIPEQLLGIGVETSWLAGDFDKMNSLLAQIPSESFINKSFEVNIGRAMNSLRNHDFEDFKNKIELARKGVSDSLASTFTSTMHQCHRALVQLHGLADLESIGELDISGSSQFKHRDVSLKLNQRLDVVGSDYTSKLYLLALRRSAVMSSQ